MSHGPLAGQRASPLSDVERCPAFVTANRFFSFASLVLEHLQGIRHVETVENVACLRRTWPPWRRQSRGSALCSTVSSHSSSRRLAASLAVSRKFVVWVRWAGASQDQSGLRSPGTNCTATNLALLALGSICPICDVCGYPDARNLNAIGVGLQDSLFDFAFISLSRNRWNPLACPVVSRNLSLPETLCFGWGGQEITSWLEGRKVSRPPYSTVAALVGCSS
jgi:hypothetical protein